MALRILVADDHEVVRCGICALLRSHPGWEICGEASDGREAVEKVAQLTPDIVILDIRMPMLNGLEAARQMLHHNPYQKIAILSFTDAEQVMKEAVKVGAKAYVLKSDAAQELIEAVEALQTNKPYFNRRVQELVLQGFLNTGDRSPKGSISTELTNRENELVRLLAIGKSTKQVATILAISVKTAETHRGNLMRKLNLHSVGELVLYAIRNSIVSLQDAEKFAETGRLGSTIAAA
jgi:DNA-binding NarL/FixJ family response regulator